MAPNESAHITEEDTLGTGRRRAARYVVPVAVIGVAAATIGLVPALAAQGDPSLPKISAQELIERIAASDTQRLSGSVKISTDLGLPSLAGLGGLAGGSLAPNGGAGGGSSPSSADPSSKLTELASGTHTLRVAVDGPDKQRVSILEKAAEYSLIHNGDEVWAYDSASNTAFHATSGESKGKGARDSGHPGKGFGGTDGKDVPATPKEFAEQALAAAGDTTSVTVEGTARVAGREAYRLVLKPKQSGSTVESVKIAVDAKTGTPLKFTLAPSSGGKAVVDVGFTQVDFAKPAASTFDFTPPKGAKVTQGDEAHRGDAAAPKLPKGGEGREGAGKATPPTVIGKGWSSVYAFTSPDGAPTAKDTAGLPKEAQGFLDALGDKVTGKFGSGTVYKTRLVNALMTDDGKIYVGAVTPATLVKAANSAK
ncbi:LolA family protein [Streptomyces liangshanensis]|uniref:Outer membrane lipoprotein carrier protein LolA n=1 Tax=Streptomyces liangshanensis TaxID=2717324 RepID=A0A6G9GZE4_9ACTN|nr:outer membrane lipoprotein carrier protein LolA [Streptomyces liangshanensis]QIQ03257.1 outer membrane lipoprotein carrier protein LolA [Streptomyces liangshanensis]